MPVIRFCLLAALFFAVLTPLEARTVIKLSTLAPKDSSYHQALVRMGQEWKRITGGKVDVIVYAGGIQGGESAMIRRMRVGQLQSALLTGVGLSEIERSVAGLQSIPMMFRDFDEVDHVGSVLHGKLEELFEAKGLKVLFWTDAGWVQFFSRKPMRTPDDLRKLKLFSWATTGTADSIARDAGLNPVPLETADILPSLQTGLIDVVAMPPFYALGTQIHTATSHMLDLRWAPLVGGLVIDKKVWDKVPEENKDEMMRVARETGLFIKETSRRESAEAVETMQRRWGLTVLTPTDAEKKLWREALEATYSRVRGEIVPEAIWDIVVPALEEWRARSGSQ